MASLSITNDEIYANLASLLGLSRDDADWDAQTLADVNRVVRQGRRKFFAAADWSFLEQQIRLLTVAPITTGTITIVNGVVTFTSSIVPTDGLNYVLVPEDEDGNATGVYNIVTRTSGTSVTLANTDIDADALTTYSLYKFRYALPSNFGAWLDPITIENNTEIQELHTLPEWMIRGIGHTTRVQTGKPQLFSVTQVLTEETGVPAHYLGVYPLPDAVYVLNSRMRVQPGDALAEVSDVFHPVFAELMLESILSAGEIMYLDARGVHCDNFDRLLPDYVKKDRMMRGTRNIRPKDYKTLPANYQALIAPITYEGT